MHNPTPVVLNEHTLYATIILRQDTTENWISYNPVLRLGEAGVETTTDGLEKLKVGDGVTPWIDLPYVSSAGGGGEDEVYVGYVGDTIPDSIKFAILYDDTPGIEYQTTQIADAQGHFTNDTVEGALDELAGELDGINELVGEGIE